MMLTISLGCANGTAAALASLCHLQLPHLLARDSQLCCGFAAFKRAPGDHMRKLPAHADGRLGADTTALHGPMHLLTAKL